MPERRDSRPTSELTEGWYEFVTSVTATTEIAYVQESGNVYTPDSTILDWEHATHRRRLVYESELVSAVTALAAERTKGDEAESFYAGGEAALLSAAASFDYPDIRWNRAEYETLVKVQKTLRARAALAGRPSEGTPHA